MPYLSNYLSLAGLTSQVAPSPSTAAIWIDGTRMALNWSSVPYSEAPTLTGTLYLGSTAWPFSGLLRCACFAELPPCSAETKRAGRKTVQETDRLVRIRHGLSEPSPTGPYIRYFPPDFSVLSLFSLLLGFQSRYTFAACRRQVTGLAGKGACRCTELKMGESGRSITDR